ncbi:MAG: hypothetical protein CMD88_02395 [Gammaproteobacteria bacterium]|nr:hypothetical protein [Gammaproteobacteria bacterium]|tara:strand:- start:27537 stop:28484 length:948 start_codon:yes stop_codon:yes gene_type:complete
MMLEISILLVIIGLLIAYILLQNKKYSDKEQEKLDQILPLNELKNSIEAFKSSQSEKTNELSKNVVELYTLLTKGGSKNQGQFGEISLKMILEHAGFQEGLSYYKQKQIGDEKPDIIINLPENRKVVIDSKVSLSDYSSYLISESDIDREQFRRNHFNAVKRHLKSLSSTDYRNTYGADSLDLVIMFMNVEGAYIMACEDELIKEALRYKIAIVGPTTLIAILQIINRTWNNKKQSEDITKVIEQATSIYDAAVLVSESFIEFNDLYDKSKNKIEQGFKRSKNLVNKVDKMRTIGGLEPKKETPVKLRSIRDNDN